MASLGNNESMDENELLLRHAQRWASGHGRPFDRELIALALDLRSTHDGLAANLWPAGSAVHLMLERWPAHGPVEPPDVMALTDSLDTFWRFLRSTGRMAGASEEPAQLRKEAGKAAKQMPEACADRSRWGSAKSLLSFGAEVGISLDDAQTTEELQERLDRITDAWNDLPQDERIRRTPALDHPQEAEGIAGPDDDDLPPLHSEAEIGALVRGSAFTAKLLALREWVGDGREITATEVLRPSVARQAYADLDLWAWERASLALDSRLGPAIPDEAMGPRSWRSARDCFALDRLWQSALHAGLVQIQGRRAEASPRIPETDSEWAGMGLMSLLGLVGRTDELIDAEVLLTVLAAVGSEPDREPMSGQAIKDWLWTLTEAEAEGGPEDPERLHPMVDAAIERCLFLFDDCNLWRHVGSRLAPTALGTDYALVLHRSLEAEES